MGRINMKIKLFFVVLLFRPILSLVVSCLPQYFLCTIREWVAGITIFAPSVLLNSLISKNPDLTFVCLAAFIIYSPFSFLYSLIYMLRGGHVVKPDFFVIAISVPFVAIGVYFILNMVPLETDTGRYAIMYLIATTHPLLYLTAMTLIFVINECTLAIFLVNVFVLLKRTFSK